MPDELKGLEAGPSGVTPRAAGPLPGEPVSGTIPLREEAVSAAPPRIAPSQAPPPSEEPKLARGPMWPGAEPTESGRWHWRSFLAILTLLGLVSGYAWV